MEMGIEIHTQDRSGRTALHLAVLNSHEEVVEGFLSTLQESRDNNARLNWTKQQFAAFINMQDEARQTALHLAITSQQEIIVEMLLRTDIDLELENSCGYTALHLAGIHGNDMIVEILVNKGANINSRIAG